MKRISLMNGSMLPKGFLIPLFSGVILSLVASCNKYGDNAEGKGASKNALLEEKNGATLVGNITINASSFGAIPDDGNDDTGPIQKAIDAVAESGGGTVLLNNGDYNVNADVSIFLKTNVTLSMTSLTRLVANPNSDGHYAVLKATNIHGARILGGKIIGDRDSHIGSIGEQGYGVAIEGSDNIRVVNTLINKCWGDGIAIVKHAGVTSTNITLKRVACSNNRRQGISVFNVNGLVIDSCQFYNTSGTLPMDGIDIEPDVAAGVVNIAENISITGCHIYSNEGNGVQINVIGRDNIVRYVTIEDNDIYDNAYSGYFQKADHVTFTDNYLYQNQHNSNRAVVDSCTNSSFGGNHLFARP